MPEEPDKQSGDQRNDRPSDQSTATPAVTEQLSPVEKIQSDVLKAQVIEALRTVYDPEIPVDIYELGLVYDVDVHSDAKVDVKMTLTSPACPVAGSLPGEVETKVRSVEGVSGASVEVVWDPPWTPDKMSDAAKLTLNL